MSYPLPAMQAPRGEMSPALAATLAQNGDFYHELIGGQMVFVSVSRAEYDAMTPQERAEYEAAHEYSQARGRERMRGLQQANLRSGLVEGGVALVAVAALWWFWSRRR